jgi:hypothetical protein
LEKLGKTVKVVWAERQLVAIALQVIHFQFDSSSIGSSLIPAFINAESSETVKRSVSAAI